MQRTHKMAIVALALLAASAASAAGVLPVGRAAGDQYLSNFYRWPDKLPARPGVMLREEPFPAQREITDAAAAIRILYTSTDVRWKSGIIPVSGTLHLPKGDPPEGGWPLLAWEHGTLGVADSCAPSWAGHRPRDAAYIDAWLKHGFAVVSTDYQGLGGPGPHTYSIWEAEGRSVLDGVRAVTAAHKGKIANLVIISGQSQGSGAALGATRLAPTYAPDVELRASIATGIVSTFPDGPYHLPPAPQTPASAYYTILAMIGGGLVDGAPPPDSLVTERGRLLLEASRETCNTQIHKIEAQQNVTAANAFKAPEAVPPLMRHSTDMTPVRMPVPMFMGTGLADSLLTPLRQYAAVVALCSAGSYVVWKTYSGVTHNGSVHAALADEFAFIDAALRGKPEPSNCGTIVEPGLPGKAESGHPFNE
jgi:hypothetical protein